MRELESRAFSAGTTPEELMEKAGAAMAEAVIQFFPEPGKLLVVFGKGHNGGDALVAARHLQQAGWELDLAPAFEATLCSELTLRKWQQLSPGARNCDGSGSCRYDVILDGLLGIGARGPLREPLRMRSQQINRLRQHSNAAVFAIDLPTGLDADTGHSDPDAVRADFTVTVGCAKKGLLADQATDLVGRLVVLELKELQTSVQNEQLLVPSTLTSLAGRRRYDTHKANYGRVAVVAGSPGLTGAALMCSHAAVRAGAGLVSLCVTPEIYPVIAAAAAPEVMVRNVSDYRQLLDEKCDAVAIGPGIGMRQREAVLDVITHLKAPLVIDADAITLLASDIDRLKNPHGPRLLTPHPGEMSRLMKTEGMNRAWIVSEFCSRFPVALLLKGARTIVGQADSPLCYNTTGSPGMATGGMGDVLTGVCAALLGQGLSVYDAGRLGAWISGRAAERALLRQSVESLAATDLLPELGGAFNDLRGGCF